MGKDKPHSWVDEYVAILMQHGIDPGDAWQQYKRIGPEDFQKEYPKVEAHWQAYLKIMGKHNADI
jgi:hypothetical protein